MIKISFHTEHLSFSSCLITVSHINNSCSGFADFPLLTVQYQCKMEKTCFFNADTILVWGRKDIWLQFCIFILAFFLSFLQTQRNKNCFYASCVKDAVCKKFVGSNCTRQGVNCVCLTACGPCGINWRVTDVTMMRTSTVCGTIKKKTVHVVKNLPGMEVEKCKHDFTGIFLHC